MPQELAGILDRNLAIDIGYDSEGRNHRLFYSPPDGVCFVAIQDPVDGTVVTVLPIHYHDATAWVVSECAQEHAQGLHELGEQQQVTKTHVRSSVLPDLLRPEASAVASPVSSELPAEVSTRANSRRLLHISACVVNRQGQEVKVKLVSVDVPNDLCLDSFVLDERLKALLNDKLVERSYDPASVDALLLRLGKVAVRVLRVNGI